MLKISINTGLVWCKTFVVEGNKKDDILGLIEEYVQNNADEFDKFDYTELLENYTEQEIEEEFLPINGGQFYIGRIESIEEI